jgi:hypothetical protein
MAYAYVGGWHMRMWVDGKCLVNNTCYRSRTQIMLVCLVAKNDQQ